VERWSREGICVQIQSLWSAGVGQTALRDPYTIGYSHPGGTSKLRAIEGEGPAVRYAKPPSCATDGCPVTRKASRVTKRKVDIIE